MKRKRRMYALIKRQFQRGTERLVDRMMRLQEVAALLSATLNPDEVADIILQQGIQALGAGAGFIAILTPDGEYLELKASTGYPEDSIGRWQRVPRSSDVPIWEAVRTGEIVLVDTLSARDERFPELTRETRDYASMAAIPMRVGEVTLGALGLSFVEASPFQQEDRDFLNILSRHAAMALERARLFQEAARRTEFEQQLMGIVSHDLRNPLGAIGMGAELLLRRVPGEAITIRRILSSTERAQRLIADLLDFTQVRLGAGIPIQREQIDGAAVTAQIVEEVRTANPGFRLVLTREGNAEGEWDGDRLAQVVSNLVRNAVQHGEPGAPVLIHLSGDETTVTLTVTNQGEPIPEALLPEIFEPMKRGDHAGEAFRRGVGLGLFIVRSLVEAHQGTIEVTSSRQEGTSFRVRLPRRAGQAPGASGSPDAHSATGPGNAG